MALFALVSACFVFNYYYWRSIYCHPGATVRFGPVRGRSRTSDTLNKGPSNTVKHRIGPLVVWLWIVG